VAIPFSMLITFVVLSLMGVTLNMVVLFSLILALGMLVDNAIVIVENIYRHRGQGESNDQAARVGTAQVSAAVIASTLTTICAFGPVMFWPGIMGEFMRYLPLTVIITLASSLLVALVFNPVLCAQFMGVPPQESSRQLPGDRFIEASVGIYRPALIWALSHRLLVIVGMNAVFVATCGLFFVLNAGTELFPDTEPQFAVVKIDAPSGTRIEMTDTYAAQIESLVAKIPDLVAYSTSVGTSLDQMTAGSAPSHQATITLEFAKMSERTTSSRASLEKLRADLAGFTGARVTVDKQEEGPPTGKPINIEVSGDDFDVLGDIARQIKERLGSVPGIVDVVDNYDHSLPELRVIPDVEKAGRYGLRTFDVAGTLRTALHGAETAKYRVGEDEYDIVVRYNKSFRAKAEDLENATIFYEGQTIPVSAFARIEYGTGIAAVNRIDARRVVTVSSDVAAGFQDNAVLAAVQTRLRDLAIPVGYAVDYTGSNEDQEEASSFLGNAFGIAILLIFVVLVSQFSSVTVPLVILSSVVLSLIGVLAGLMITRTPFGIIMTGVGVISLAGIVVNNAIVLLDYIIQLRQRGLTKTEAIVRAGVTRFRPVMLTAITTILGLIPLTTGLSLDFAALFAGRFGEAIHIGGESSQWWGPMGVAVIWGLAVATFLTLIVVPVMYSSLDPLKRFLYSVTIGWWRKDTNQAGSRQHANDSV